MIYVSYIQNKNAIAVSFPYDPQKVEVMREAAQSFKLGKSAWDAENRQWRFKLDALPFIQSKIPALELSKELQAIWDVRRRAAVEESLETKNLSSSLLGSIDFNAQTKDGKLLMAHQKNGINVMLSEGSAILAGEPGTGKTLAMLLYAKAWQNVIPDLRVFALVKPYLVPNWKREAAAVGLNQIECFSTHFSKIPTPPEEPFVLLADESHAFRNPSAKSTKAFLALAEKAKGVICATGTPLANGRPFDLWTSLLATKHELSRFGKTWYEKRFCDGRLETIYVKGGRQLRIWKNNGASNLDELKSRLGKKLITWKKSECLDLPPVTYQRVDVPFVGKEAKIFREFYEARLKLAVDERRVVLEERKKAGESFTPVEEKLALEVDAIAKDTFLRNAASLAKIEIGAEIAKDTNACGFQTIIFAAFKETAEKIAETLGCPFITSDVPGGKRQKIVDDFQSGKHQNIVLTYGSGETGLNLQKAGVVIRVDRVWQWAQNEQAVARADRIGQENKVTVYDVLFGDIDEGMWQALAEKAGSVEALIGNERHDFEKVDLPRIKAELVQRAEERLSL